jgi:hypothetical protein
MMFISVLSMGFLMARIDKQALGYALLGASHGDGAKQRSSTWKQLLASRVGDVF